MTVLIRGIFFVYGFEKMNIELEIAEMHGGSWAGEVVLDGQLAEKKGVSIWLSGGTFKTDVLSAHGPD